MNLSNLFLSFLTQVWLCWPISRQYACGYDDWAGAAFGQCKSNITHIRLTLTAIVEGFGVPFSSCCEILKPRWWSWFDAKNIEGNLIYNLFSTTKKGEQPIKANRIILGFYMQRERLFILQDVQTIRIAVYACSNTFMFTLKFVLLLYDIINYTFAKLFTFYWVVLTSLTLPKKIIVFMAFWYQWCNWYQLYTVHILFTAYSSQRQNGRIHKHAGSFVT